MKVPAPIALTVPSSKSLGHRYLIAAALSDPVSEVNLCGWSDDLRATERALTAILHGEPTADCGESATTLRLLTPLAGVLGWRGEFLRRGRLAERPTLSFAKSPRYVIPGNVSSQFVSGLLMALPLADWDSEVVVDGRLESAGYVALTEKVLAESGIVIDRRTSGSWQIPGRQHYHLAGPVTVEGDWSAGAVWLAMGLDRAAIAGLDPDSMQPDRAIVPYLTALNQESPEPLTIDVADTPDLYPLLATVAAMRGRPVKFVGTERLRLKESDRLATTAAMLAAVASIPARGAGEVPTGHDHRVAMAAAVAMVRSGKELELDDYECVNKSYPGFWAEFRRVFGQRGLIGRQLGHSLSPAVHRLFGACAYRLWEREPAEVATFFRRQDWAAVNVTLPYKRPAAQFCAALSPLAERLGNVNLVVRRPDGSLYGDNTDYAGFQRMVAVSGVAVAGRRALVLGAGGAGTTAAAVLGDLGAAVTVDHRGDSIDLDAEILVNATPVGMWPQSEALPIELARFPKLAAVFDLVYNPSPTRLVRDARARGLFAADGLVMLVYQAWLSGPQPPLGPVFLYGPPGAGKTTLGRAAATALGLGFYDLDGEIERHTGRTVAALFAEGEATFRSAEKAAIAEVVAAVRGQAAIIALGGGTLLDAENAALVATVGRVVALSAPDAVLWERVRTDGQRPLAANESAFLALLARRRAHYRRYEDAILPE